MRDLCYRLGEPPGFVKHYDKSMSRSGRATHLMQSNDGWKLGTQQAGIQWSVGADE